MEEGFASSSNSMIVEKVKLTSSEHAADMNSFGESLALIDDVNGSDLDRWLDEEYSNGKHSHSTAPSSNEHLYSTDIFGSKLSFENDLNHVEAEKHENFHNLQPPKDDDYIEMRAFDEEIFLELKALQRSYVGQNQESKRKKRRKVRDMKRKRNNRNDERQQADLFDFHGSRQDAFYDTLVRLQQANGKYNPEDKNSLNYKKQKLEQKDVSERYSEKNVCHTKLADKNGTENRRNKNSITDISGNEDVSNEESDVVIKEELLKRKEELLKRKEEVQKQNEKLLEKKMFPKFPRIPFVAPVKFSSHCHQQQENPKFPPHLSQGNSLSQVQVKSEVSSIFNNVRHFSYPEKPFKSGMQSNVKNTNDLSGVGYHDMLSMKYNIGDFQNKNARNMSSASILTNCNARNTQLLSKSTYESGMQYSNTLDLTSGMNNYVSPLQYKNALKKLALSMRLSEQSRAKIIWRR